VHGSVLALPNGLRSFAESGYWMATIVNNVQKNRLLHAQVSKANIASNQRSHIDNDNDLQFIHCIYTWCQLLTRRTWFYL
jgi:hypothetical protein